MIKKLSIIFAFVPLLLAAQENDFQAWYSISAGIKTGDKWTVEFSNEIRTDYNAQIFSRNLLDLGMEYELSKKVDVGLYTRYSTEYPMMPEHNSSFTFYGTVQYTKKFDRLQVSGRFRAGSDEDGNYLNGTEWEHREKLKLTYDLKGFPLNPEASCEFFFPAPDNFLDLSKTRVLAGFSWKPGKGKSHSFSLQYGWQHKYNTAVPQNDFLLCLGYKFTIKPFEKKK